MDNILNDTVSDEVLLAKTSGRLFVRRQNSLEYIFTIMETVGISEANNPARLFHAFLAVVRHSFAMMCYPSSCFAIYTAKRPYVDISSDPEFAFRCNLVWSVTIWGAYMMLLVPAMMLGRDVYYVP
jgi:hypothetical protein